MNVKILFHNFCYLGVLGLISLMQHFLPPPLKKAQPFYNWTKIKIYASENSSFVRPTYTSPAAH